MLHTMEFLRNIQNHAEEIGGFFTSPDDDWTPCLWLFGHKKVHVCDIRLMFQNKETKEQIPEAIKNMVRQFKAISGALLISQWYVSLDRASPGFQAAASMIDSLGVRTRPDRKEQLMVELCDGKTTEIWTAEIIRSTDKPPTLKEWKEFKTDLPASGRLANILTRALKGE